MNHRLLPILLVHDGKPGHRAQAEGLSLAFAYLREAVCYEYNIGQKSPFPQMDEAPQLVISVGRHSASDALRLAKEFGAKKIALMNPGWWKRTKFDLCIIPKHDGLAASDKIILTLGALNGVHASPEAPQNKTLILIGGPSAHHGWNEGLMCDQLEALMENSPDIDSFTVTSSRRTPPEMVAHLKDLSKESDGRFNFTPANETPRGWVAAQLEQCGTCWVSEDSVSMVYEALSAGAAVGLLDVPRKTNWRGKPGRVVSGVLDLVKDGLVVPFDAWREGKALVKHEPLREAERVAQLILNKWPEL